MFTPTLHDLHTRLQTLEDTHAIQALKARYLRACDQKQPETVRQCFAREQVLIEADGFPACHDREAWVHMFTQLAVHNPHVIDMHHGHNMEIHFTGPDTAQAWWDLEFRQIHLQTRTVVTMSGTYHDHLVREQGQWVIQRMRFTRAALLMENVSPEGQVQVVAFGQPPATGFLAPPPGADTP